MGLMLGYGTNNGTYARHAGAGVRVKAARNARGAHGAHGVHGVRSGRGSVASVVFGRGTAALLRRAAFVVLVPACALCLCIGMASMQNVTGHASGAIAAKAVSPTRFENAATPTESVASSESFILETSATRNVASALEQVQAEEEQLRIASEQAEQQAEQEAIQQAQQAQSRASSAAVGIGNVDFTVGREAFIAEWTARIDTYLEDSPLAGYGANFAEAAWDNGVDPRWSPAISCTESTKGVYLSAAHNAWGWTGGSWADWPTAISAHVAGLAKGYGHTITYANAARYCPPNTAHWYRTTLSEMAKI